MNGITNKRFLMLLVLIGLLLGAGIAGAVTFNGTSVLAQPVFNTAGQADDDEDEDNEADDVEDNDDEMDEVDEADEANDNEDEADDNNDETDEADAADETDDNDDETDEADETEEPITGPALEQASAAALEYLGEGQVTETEIGDEEGFYEVEVTLPDGSEVDVHLDENFNVLGHETD